jgi:threonine dehydratase
MIELADVALARYRISPYLPPTPLEHIADNLWFKLENLNQTRAFKTRGALNALLSLKDRDHTRGLVACSSGNHALGVAYAAHLLKMKARILMPHNTSRRKIAGVERYGSEAILFGDNYDEAEEEARRLEHKDKLTFISPYNNPQVVAGAGTIGLEIIDVLPEVERVLVPIGGGGLISGVALALKSVKPGIELIGVCAQAAPVMYNLFYDTAHPQEWDTLAEALSGDIEPDSITVDLAQRFVDEIVLVSEEAIAEAMRWVLLKQGWLVEGGGVVGIAALHSGVVEQNSKPTVVVLSGGNVDEDRVLSILNRS